MTTQRMRRGTKIKEVASGRNQWKVLEEAFANIHTELRDIPTGKNEIKNKNNKSSSLSKDVWTDTISLSQFTLSEVYKETQVCQ